MEQISEIKIEGMHCDGCVRRVRAGLAKVQGLAVESVEVGKARIRSEDAAAATPAIREVLAQLGFQLSS